MSAARNLDAEFLMEERTIRLEERVGFILSDVGEIKTDLRRLDTKIDGVRDALSVVEHSLSAKIDKEVCQLSAKIDKDVAHLSDKIEKDVAGLSVRMDTNLAHLSAKIDKDVAHLSAKVDTSVAYLSAKIDESKASLKDTANALFDKKFFRALSVFVAALPLLGAGFAYVQKASLGMTEITVLAVGVSVVICVATFLATRTHR
jgi:chromosome segregation ATPase